MAGAEELFLIKHAARETLEQRVISFVLFGILHFGQEGKESSNSEAMRTRARESGLCSLNPVSNQTAPSEGEAVWAALNKLECVYTVNPASLWNRKSHFFKTRSWYIPLKLASKLQSFCLHPTVLHHHTWRRKKKLYFNLEANKKKPTNHSQAWALFSLSSDTVTTHSVQICHCGQVSVCPYLFRKRETKTGIE